jgi:anti-sigma B factor antagonist
LQPATDANSEVPGALTVRATRNANQLVLARVGELDLSTSEFVEQALEEHHHDPAERLVIDLSGLSFMDSTGLRLIILLHARCVEKWRPRA